MRVRKEQKRLKRYKSQDTWKAKYKLININLTATTLSALGIKILKTKIIYLE